MAGLGSSCSPFVLVDQAAEDPQPPNSRRLWGARGPLGAVTCVDMRIMVIGNDDRLCLSVCSTWSSRGSAAGWSCAAQKLDHVDGLPVLPARLVR